MAFKEFVTKARGKIQETGEKAVRGAGAAAAAGAQKVWEKYEEEKRKEQAEKEFWENLAKQQYVSTGGGIQYEDLPEPLKRKLAKSAQKAGKGILGAQMMAAEEGIPFTTPEEKGVVYDRASGTWIEYTKKKAMAKSPSLLRQEALEQRFTTGVVKQDIEKLERRRSKGRRAVEVMMGVGEAISTGLVGSQPPPTIGKGHVRLYTGVPVSPAPRTPGRPAGLGRLGSMVLPSSLRQPRTGGLEHLRGLTIPKGTTPGTTSGPLVRPSGLSPLVGSLEYLKAPTSPKLSLRGLPRIRGGPTQSLEDLPYGEQLKRLRRRLF